MKIQPKSQLKKPSAKFQPKKMLKKSSAESQEKSSEINAKKILHNISFKIYIESTLIFLKFQPKSILKKCSTKFQSKSKNLFTKFRSRAMTKKHSKKISLKMILMTYFIETLSPIHTYSFETYENTTPSYQIQYK